MDPVELLKRQFSCAHAFVSSSSLFPASISPAHWLRLQSLDLQATSGPCTYAPPPPTDVENRALWRCWKQLGSMSGEEAQEQFVRQVLQHCESLEHEMEVLAFLREFGQLSVTRKPNGKSKPSRKENLTPTASSTSANQVNVGTEEDMKMTVMMRREKLRLDDEEAQTRAVDLKATLSALTEELAILNANAREDVRHMSLAVQADVTIEERTMEARDVRTNVEELGHDVHLMIRQLESDIDAALSRRKWSYEQIENQCEELLARCETTANTYTNQLSLTHSGGIFGFGASNSDATFANSNSALPSRTTLRPSLKTIGIISSSILIPIGAGLSYFLFKRAKPIWR